VLTAEEVKQEVRAEMSAAVAEGLAAEVATLPATLATTLVGQWQTFCANHGVVCQVAAQNNAYRALLDTLPVADLTRLVQLTDLFWTELGVEAGPAQLVAALDNGTFAKLMAAPPVADAILAGTGSPAIALAWVDVAGEMLPTVVELRLYDSIDPLRMSTLSLATLLAIEDNATIHKLRQLPTEQLLTLLQLSSADLAQIAAVATTDELGWLAGHLATLPTEAAVTTVQELLRGDVTIALLQAPPVVQAEVAPARAAPAAHAEVREVERDPVTEVPVAVTTWWSAWPLSSVAIAAGFVVLLLIAVGMALALRREIVDPPL
jgi:hypothetical protein